MIRSVPLALVALLGAGAAAAQSAPTPRSQPLLTGAAAMGDWRTDAPGVRRKLTPADLPAPFATPAAQASPGVIPRPEGAQPKVPPGFAVQVFASDLKGPRVVRTAPNGNIFVSESYAGRVTILRPGANGAAAERSIFAEGLKRPFGIAFYPPGPNPQWVYVGNTDSVVRLPYRNGDLKARGAAETVVAKLPGGGHWTRDLAFSPDGKRLFVSVGSASNVAEEMPKKTVAEAQAWDRAHGLGASWDSEEDRADVLAFTPDGKGRRVFAAGIRNCAGLQVQPGTGELWCATNERDNLGDNLVPDYVTRVREGRFYGWPWFYIGDHEDPRLKGQRPDLRGKVTVPDVLIDSHSAPLGLVFYPQNLRGAAAFPSEYGGDAFVALHGSWNREHRTGYKVVRVRLEHGAPTGEYDDFLTGFVADASSVWGRPVDTAVAKDGALLVSDDAGGVIWRVAPTK
jgi:glucose/arabinose dehydrogenase